MYKYIVTVVVTAIASLFTAVMMFLEFVRLIKRQIKLSHSINLVQLKARKTVYWLFAGALAFLIVALVIAMASPDNKIIAAISGLFGVDRTLANIAFVFPLVAMNSAAAFIIMLAIGKNGIVDKGVYTNYSMLDWHQVRDYVIDEERCILILSSDRGTFSTLKNLTTPYRVKRDDIEKVKFILNKNKNKFSGFVTDQRNYG